MEKLRIIGGKWRSRKLNFVAEKGVRPTKDMVRETLFNWLGTNVVGANCLDLFAGSGALGFEALSRGAKKVTFVDQSSKVVAKLRENADLLGASLEQVGFYSISVPKETIPEQQFDVIFLDPPFRQGVIDEVCKWLVANNYLRKGALIYIETERELDILPIPSDWQILKSKQSGQVKYYLVQV